MRPIRVLLSIAAASLLPACGVLPFEAPETDCTTEYIASTRTTVVNARGEPQPDARVTFTLDGGSEQEAWCAQGDAMAPAGPGCVAWETPGPRGIYVLRATSADGQRRAEQRVEVPGDACHAERTVPVELVLPD